MDNIEHMNAPKFATELFCCIASLYINVIWSNERRWIDKTDRVFDLCGYISGIKHQILKPYTKNTSNCYSCKCIVRLVQTETDIEKTPLFLVRTHRLPFKTEPR